MEGKKTKTDWTLRFIQLAEHYSTWSKDTSTKVGVVIVNDAKRVLASGYNGLPSGCDDSKLERFERPAKYFYTEHAERNAIYNAGREGVKLQGSTIYCTMFPCADCARAIIQVGIKKVVAPVPDLTLPIWGEHFRIASEMFKEAKIEEIWLWKGSPS